MIDQIRNIFTQPASIPQQSTGVKPAGNQFAQGGNNSLDTSLLQRAGQNFRDGKSLVPEGALGENAINGTSGGKLNLFA